MVVYMICLRKELMGDPAAFGEEYWYSEQYQGNISNRRGENWKIGDF